MADPRIDERVCCCEPVEQIRERGSGDVIVLWCQRCNWTHDLRSDEDMPDIYDHDAMSRLIDDLLSPESLGYRANAEIRDRARECKGLDPVEGGQNEI